MKCKYNSFDLAIHRIERVTDEDELKILYDCYQEASFSEFLDECVARGIIPNEHLANTIWDFTEMWEDLDGTYYEEDNEKLTTVLDAIGLTPEVFVKFNS